MDLRPILEVLRDKFGLKENHLAIINALNDKKMHAQEISKKTGIPMGRIYEFLNEMVDMCLVEKTDSTPAEYFIRDFEQRVYEFLNHQTTELNKKQSTLVSTVELQSKNPSNIRVINNQQDLIFELVKQINKDNNFRISTIRKSAPYFFYPEDKGEFAKMREALISKRNALTKSTTALQVLLNDAYNKALKASKKFTFVIPKEAWDFFIENLVELHGKKFTKEYLINLKKRMEKYKLSTRITKNELPYYMFLSENSFVLAVLYEKNTIGMAIDDKITSELFVKIFTSLFDAGTDLKYVIDDAIKSLK